MKQLNNFITEKLHLNKDIKLNNDYVDNIIEMINPELDEQKIRGWITDWIGDYDKRLYCYVGNVDYKYKWKDYFKKYDNIWISNVDETILSRDIKIASQSTVYHSLKNNINKIAFSQYNLLIKIKSWQTIVFEKSHI